LGYREIEGIFLIKRGYRKLGYRELEEIFQIRIGRKEAISSSFQMVLTLLVMQLMVGFLVTTICTLLGVADIKLIILACCVAPISEEAAKRIAILKGYPWLYTGIFGGIEASLYVSVLSFRAIATGIFTGQIISVVISSRLLGLAIHFALTIVQQQLHKESKESGPKFLSKFGFVIAILMHFVWNAAPFINSLK
jgi:hypothetical protein